MWVRFRQGASEGFGWLENEQVAVHAGDMFAGAVATGGSLALGDVALLAPVRPGRFIGLWNNFHAAREKNGWAMPAVPLWFLKNPGCVVGPGATVRPPASYAGRVIYEGELGVVVGRRCQAVSEDEAAAAIFGFTCVNDVTALDLLNEDASFPQWARAKGCDGFGPVGPGIVPGFDWAGARVTVSLNGRVRQDYALADMIFSPAAIIAAVSREMTLEAGDVIACGTSVGALPMRPGMDVAVSIEGLGVLRHRFEAEPR